MALSRNPPSQRHEGRHQPPCIHPAASKTKTPFFGHAYKTVDIDNERRVSAELRPPYLHLQARGHQ